MDRGSHKRRCKEAFVQSEWARKSYGAYEAAKKKGIFTEVTSHMQKPPQKLKWDDASIATDALKYESKSQWKRNSIGAYTAAKKRGIFDSVTSHM